MNCPKNVIQGNDTELFIAEEECPGVLPSSVVWRQQEPNSYSGFGEEIETVKRETINPSRQNQKGTAVGRDASGGYNTDVTKNNMTWMMQGFMFADARQGPSTVRIDSDDRNVTVVADSSGNKAHTIDSAMDPVFRANDLVFASGYVDLANNGVQKVISATSTEVVVGTGTDRASVATTANLECVGIEFEAADVDVSYVSDVLSITSTLYDFTANPNLFPGQVIYLGGDVAGSSFDNNGGYVRIREILTNALVLEEPTWTPQVEVGTGKSIRLFFGITVKNENVKSLIKARTYQAERVLGKSPQGYDHAEYLEGCTANSLDWSIQSKSKVTVDIGLDAITYSEVLGETDGERKAGTYVPILGQDAINTSNDVFLMRMGLTNLSDSTVTPLFSFVQEANLAINNNSTTQDAVGKLGGIDTTVGSFNVTGSVTAYFTSLAVKRAMRTLQDVSMTFILARENSGLILDIPNITLNGGGINVEKDGPITIPINADGVENKFGYTMSYTQFPYLPDAAMPN